jgi:hypothetical protein
MAQDPEIAATDIQLAGAASWMCAQPASPEDHAVVTMHHVR